MIQSRTLLHFTLGPVQGFIAQARRTRDLWAGSFLLSWLAGQAMAAVVDACDGDADAILFPQVARDPLFQAIRGTVDWENPPKIGSLPNRFKAVVPENFDPELCVRRIKERWWNLAEAVWERYALDALSEENSHYPRRKIWERQIENFWEASWVMGAEPGDGSDGAWLDRRKNWRSHVPPVEPGDHCMLMGDLQEMSGWVRAKDRDQQDIFWTGLWKKTKQRAIDDGSLELKRLGSDRDWQELSDRDWQELMPSERLCAVALVKRLFPLLPPEVLERKEIIGWVPGGQRPNAANRHQRTQAAVRNWQSTAYMAAVHWVERAWTAAPDACTAHAKAVDKVSTAMVMAERATVIPCLKELGEEAKIFVGLDGDAFFMDALVNPRATPTLGAKPDTDERRAVIDSLKRLQEQLPVRESSAYYALLLMDGDRTGKLLRDLGDLEVSKALAIFTEGVPGIVREHNGVLIYAGGDDVLALLPLRDALDCAMALRRAYGEAWRTPGAGTISAGLVFAEYSVPLRQVIDTAHDGLDNVAKGRNGRDSLAVTVLKPSGTEIQWVSTWDAAREDAEPGTAPLSPPRLLMELARTMAGNPPFSSKFLHNVRDRYARVLTDSDGRLTDGLDPRAVVLAEYRKSRGDDVTADGGEQAVDGVLTISRCHRRTDDGILETRMDVLRSDGAMLLRFLAREGQWNA